MKNAAAILIVSVLLTAPGCGVNYVEPQVPAEPAGTSAGRNFDAVWAGSLEVLRDYRFGIDRQDRRVGIITTRPMLARHWFEFWRTDAVSNYDFLEGSLQTVMRRVEVQITPRRGRPDEYEPVVTIEVTRPDRQGLEIVAASEAYSRFFDTHDVGDTEYSRYKRNKKLKREYDRTLLHDGRAAADELARESGYMPHAPEGLGRHDTLAHKLAADIRAAAAKRLARP